MRMQDKVLQFVTDGAKVLDACAIIRNVWLRAGRMYGKYNGRSVVNISGGVWRVS